jgi:hypothetical protein
VNDEAGEAPYLVSMFAGSEWRAKFLIGGELSRRRLARGAGGMKFELALL